MTFKKLQLKKLLNLILQYGLDNKIQKIIAERNMKKYSIFREFWLVVEEMTSAVRP